MVLNCNLKKAKEVFDHILTPRDSHQIPFPFKLNQLSTCCSWGSLFSPFRYLYLPPLIHFLFLSWDDQDGMQRSRSSGNNIDLCNSSTKYPVLFSTPFPILHFVQTAATEWKCLPWIVPKWHYSSLSSYRLIYNHPGCTGVVQFLPSNTHYLAFVSIDSDCDDAARLPGLISSLVTTSTIQNNLYHLFTYYANGLSMCL